jgi:hypothetical protein
MLLGDATPSEGHRNPDQVADRESGYSGFVPMREPV